MQDYVYDNIQVKREVGYQKKIGCCQSKAGFFNANVINECPEKCKMLVGVSFPVLEKLFKYLCSDIKVAGTKPACATMEDQIIITLLKLKHNVSFDMLGYMNNINQSSAANYFQKWVNIVCKIRIFNSNARLCL